MRACAECGAPIVFAGRGRPPATCSAECKADRIRSRGTVRAARVRAELRAERPEPLCVRCGLEFVPRANARKVCYRPACQMCRQEGCDRKRHRADYCQRHTARALRHGDASTEVIERDHNRPAFCDVGGCDEPTARRFLCSAHYQRFKDHGHPLGFIRKHGGIAPTCLWFVCDRPVDTRGRCKWHHEQTPAGMAMILNARSRRKGAHMPGETTPAHLDAEETRGVCGICGEPILTGDRTAWDHRHPWCDDGKTDDENIQLAHASCNSAKNGTVDYRHPNGYVNPNARKVAA